MEILCSRLSFLTSVTDFSHRLQAMLQCLGLLAHSQNDTKNSEEKKITVDDSKTRHTAATGSSASLLPSAAPPSWTGASRSQSVPAAWRQRRVCAAKRTSSEKKEKENQSLVWNCTRRGKHSTSPASHSVAL